MRNATFQWAVVLKSKKPEEKKPADNKDSKKNDSKDNKKKDEKPKEPVRFSFRFQFLFSNVYYYYFFIGSWYVEIANDFDWSHIRNQTVYCYYCIFFFNFVNHILLLFVQVVHWLLSLVKSAVASK